MGLKILATGDLHLGRNPSGYGRENVDFITTKAMLDKIFAYACEEQVSALLLAGDIVNSSKAFFSSLKPIQTGLDTLAGVGIPVYAVAGNHDVELLSRLSNVLDSETFTVLGQDGNWESKTLNAGGIELDIWGKSFTSESTENNPTRNFPRNNVRQGIQSLGLLHCDLGGNGSYAPVKRDDLLGCGISNWVLGHIHLPGILQNPVGDNNIFYTGSPLPLDPGEKGHHGPCLIEYNDSGLLSSITRLALSPLRYEEIDINVDNAENIEDVQEKMAVSIRDFADGIFNDDPQITHLSMRVRLKGRTELKEDEILPEIKLHLADDECTSFHEKINIYVERIYATFEPIVDFDEYLGSTQPLGVAADMLYEINGNSEMSPELELMLQELVKEIAGRNKGKYHDLEPETLPGEEEIRKIAEEQILRIAHDINDQSEERA